MRNRRGFFILFGLIIGLAVFLVLRNDAEPEYQGRPLSEWLRRLSVQSDESLKAIRAIGTNAIPSSLKWICYERSPWRVKVVQLIQKHLPSGFPRFGLDQLPEAEDRAMGAMIVFELLGPEARSAIPRLTELAQQASDGDTPFRCVVSLRFIGPEAFPSLFHLAKRGRPKVRAAVLEELFKLRNQTTNVIPTLLKGLEDESPYVTDAARDLLASHELSSDAVVPALTNLAQTASAGVRGEALRCLVHRQYPKAQLELLLQRAMMDSDHVLRGLATNIMHIISARTNYEKAPPD